jgi:methylenetetrahydrofolate dehydrogenase (NADP+)/methenyltetrahydrofolate cyclohydrolase
MDNFPDMKKICEAVKADLKEKLKNQPYLRLASVRVGEDYASGVYASNQERLARQLGVDYQSIQLGPASSLEETLRVIDELNNDKTITGIIVNKPFPSSWREEEVFSAITPTKDVEGMHPCNLGKLFSGQAPFVSPTVLGVLEVLRRLKKELYGKDVTLVGFSNLIGMPLAILLGRRFATVTITHIATHSKGRLPFYVGCADILITAVGNPHLIKGEWIKQGAVVIDVGVGQKDGKIVGDVEYEEAIKRAAFVTPTPGGIGRLTNFFLFDNLIKAAQP